MKQDGTPLVLLDLATPVYVLEFYKCSDGTGSIRTARAAYAEHSSVCPAARTDTRSGA